MSKTQKNSPKDRSKLFDTFKLLVVNDETFEEVFSQRLSRLNAFVFLVIFVGLVSALSFFVIAVTPLRYFIPGIESAALQREVETLLVKTDSLQRVIETDSKYIEGIRRVLSGEVVYEAPEIDSTTVFMDAPSTDQLLETRKSIAMLELESQVKKEEAYSPVVETTISNPLYFAPLSGVVSGAYDPTVDTSPLILQRQKEQELRRSPMARYYMLNGLLIQAITWWWCIKGRPFLFTNTMA